MNTFLALLIAVILPVSALATPAPYSKAVDARFKSLENDLAEAAGIAKKVARVEYDVSVDGGASSPSAKSLGVVLPAGAVVTNILVYVNTQFAGGAQSESLALQCNTGNRDLMDWQDIGALDANSVLFGGLSPTAATALSMLGTTADVTGIEKTGAVSIPSACIVQALVRGDAGYTPYTAGKITAVIEYFNKN